jgi:hypothetical protein
MVYQLLTDGIDLIGIPAIPVRISQIINRLNMPVICGSIPLDINI